MTRARPIAAAVLLAAGSAAAQAPAPAPAGTGADPFAGNACVECHGDLPGRLSEIVELEWKRSMHYQAGVSCDGCHGGNPAARRDAFDSGEAWKLAAHLDRDAEFTFIHRPDSLFVSTARGRSVSYFCGKCHADIKEKHLGSPHGEFGDPTCLYCHGGGSHLIEEPTLDLIDVRGREAHGRCSPCHLASTMESVTRIKKLLSDTEERIRSAGVLYGELEQWGYHNLELEKLHHQVGEVRSRLRQIFHSFNMLEISNFTSEIVETAERTESTHALVARLRDAQRRQARDGGLVAIMLLAFAGLLVYYRHAFLREGYSAAAAGRTATDARRSFTGGRPTE
jgi:hypothetical protein